MESVGRLWLAGVRPEWSALHAGHRRRRVRLPTYPFERKRYWIEPRQSLPSLERIQRRADPGEWMYVPSWRRAPAPSGEPNKRGANWLLFIDQHGLGAQLEAELIGGGARVASVALSERFAINGPGKYTLNPAAREDYVRLVAELKGASFTPQFIAHLWSVSRDEELREDAQFLAQCEERGLFSVVYLVQALEAGGLNAPLGLSVITTHVHEVSGRETLCPEKAMVLGPCKVIGMEHPHILTRSIDVTVDGDLRWLARALNSDLCAPWTEPVVAYRGRYRWVQAYEQIRPEAPAALPKVLRDDGVYLITGGLGNVGLELAQYLARTVRARIALVGRTPLPAKEQWAQWLAAHDESHPTSRKIRRIQQVEAAGAAVLVCQADVADERQMRAAIAAAEARFGPLCGVMHAAGAARRDVPIRSLQRSDCEEQFRPRLQGLRTLEKVLHDRSLDFCVVHSSLAAVMGVLDFVSYTAAHLFMDAYVHRHNREARTPWRTINWDTWNFGTPSAESRTTADTAFSKLTFYMMPAEGTDVLSRLLSMTDATQALVSSADLQGRIDQWIRREKPQADETQEEKAPTSHAHPRPALSSQYEAPRTDAERLLADLWRNMFGIDQVGIHDNFFELGGDSLLAVQVASRLRQALRVELPLRDLFAASTVSRLAARIEALRADPRPGVAIDALTRQAPGRPAGATENREEIQL